MASVGATPQAGKKKSLDAEINLVPFIDLLSMCICFLLMTAVWMEIGGVNLKQAVGTEAADSTNKFDMQVRYLSLDKLEISLNKGGKGKSVSVQGATNEERLAKLRDAIKEFASTIGAPAGSDLKAQMAQMVSAARVTTKAGVSYGEIVSVMDALRDQGIVNLGLVPVRE